MKLYLWALINYLTLDIDGFYTLRNEVEVGLINVKVHISTHNQYNFLILVSLSLCKSKTLILTICTQKPTTIVIQIDAPRWVPNKDLYTIMHNIRTSKLSIKL